MLISNQFYEPLRLFKEFWFGPSNNFTSIRIITVEFTVIFSLMSQKLIFFKNYLGDKL